jgi:hypothetical protein
MHEFGKIKKRMKQHAVRYNSEDNEDQRRRYIVSVREPHIPRNLCKLLRKMVEPCQY